jgi:ABC-type sugar transport system permease subunit
MGLEAEFIGIDNYVSMLSDNQLYDSLVRSGIYTGSTTAISVSIGLLLALCLNESPLRRYLQAVVIIPWAVPYAVSAAAFKWFFNDIYGAANDLLIRLGLITGPISWLLDPALAFAVLIACDAWMRIPFATLVLLAGLQAIPDELHEAAKVDGAGAAQRFFNITLPLLKAPLLITLLIITVFSIRTVSLPLALTGGGPGEATTTFALYLYKSAFFIAGRLGYATALGVLLLLIVIIMALIQIRSVKITA